MSQLDQLKSAKTRKSLARLLGYTPSSLTSILYKMPIEQKYNTFEISKKNGGKRLIKAPTPKLKKLQGHLAQLLYGCLKEIEADRGKAPVSFGFRKEQSILDNARKHKRRRYVLNLDLSDFFPTFHFGRVRGFFFKDKAFELTEEVATTIAQIACDGTALPQGSPCSPVISELISQILDARLLGFAKKHKVTYSRYADDISFSTNAKTFPVEVAFKDNDNQSIWNLSSELVAKIERAGFEINADKVRMHIRDSRQMVTGLVVNDKVNVRTEYYRNARAMCFSLFQTGAYYKSQITVEDDDDKAVPEWIDNLAPLEGILGHIHFVSQAEERRELTEQRSEPTAIRKLFRRFLFYKYCIANSKPLIITEGKTDPIYLREAIKKRREFHPTLGQPGDQGFVHAVQYFNYTSKAHEIMNLGGGTGDLKSIILDYLHNLYPSNKQPHGFTHKPMHHPVIMLLDSDDGIGSIASTIKKNFGVIFSWESTDDFYHITDNLYVVKTPEIDGKKSCIEDLFPQQWRKKKLKGKTFDPSSKIDTSKHYGKEVFANSVIKKNAGNICFNGFDPLLDRIVKVILHYQPVDTTVTG